MEFHALKAIELIFFMNGDSFVIRSVDCAYTVVFCLLYIILSFLLSTLQ